MTWISRFRCFNGLISLTKQAAKSRKTTSEAPISVRTASQGAINLEAQQVDKGHTTEWPSHTGKGSELEHGVTAPMVDVLEDVCSADYVDVDSSAVVCGALTDDDIICQVRSAEPVAASDDDEEEDEAPVRPFCCGSHGRIECRPSLLKF
ncbi:hypothetical protein MTO96_040523 [Rhipicephalus appendiculatus]